MLLTSCSGPDKYPKYWHAGSEKPYMVDGVKYFPQIHYQYMAVGDASWYGYDCHGKPTATGRKFEKDKLTAAHRTLPLPCVVMVENLENKKKVKLLVNDRGPFAQTNRRIIDVSQKAAEVLGFRRKGHARVKVTCLPKESQLAAIAYHRKPYSSKL
jgi:rare lipoprotein A